MQVIDFFEGPLGLLTSEDSYTIEGRRIKGGVTRQDLKTIPIMMVGMEALNDNMRVLQSDHFGSNQIMTRGMCLSEHDTNKDDDDQEQVLTGVVTAILCLVGLPSDLTASILAHGMSFYELSTIIFSSYSFHISKVYNDIINLFNRGDSRLH